MIDIGQFNVVPAIICLSLAVGTAWLLARRAGVAVDHGRYSAIDGLRGYLAFFVFLDHSSIWFGYLRSGHWVVPSSRLYTHFGESSVALFFMITGFLFFGKILESRTRIDWLRLYVSRVLRLTPLYMVAVLLIVIAAFVCADGKLVDTPTQLTKDVIRWLSFTILGNPNLNGLPNTWTVVAGATWSLPYEWFFYLALPIIALLLGGRPRALYVPLGAVGIAAYSAWRPEPILLVPFLGGIVAVFVVRAQVFVRFAKTKVGSLAAASAFAATVALFDTANAISPLLLLTVAFCLIAAGTTLFGILEWRSSKLLGEQAYSLYLLHGACLFGVFQLGIGVDDAKRFTPMEHWLVVAAITPVLVAICYLTFRYVESPPMKMAGSVAARIRRALPGASQPSPRSN